MHPLVHNVFKPLLVAVAAILVGHCGALGCAKSTTAPGPTEAAYLTDRLACIQIYQTREDAQSCMDDVDRRFGVPVGSGQMPEAGTEGGK